LASHINRFQNDIHRCVGFIQDPKKLNELITQIYATHVQDNFVRTDRHPPTLHPDDTCSQPVCELPKKSKGASTDFAVGSPRGQAKD